MLLGPSGSGKTTLLNIIGTLDKPDQGEILYKQKGISRLSESKRDKFRRNNLGYIFQSVALVANMTVYENIDFFLRIAGFKYKERYKRIKECLEFVGLDKRMGHFPSQMSGGEQQRVAIAIALANNPRILFADEPTGSVDKKIAYHILNMLRQLNQELGITMIIVTHDPKVASRVDRVISINDGMIGSEMHKKAYTYDNPNPKKELTLSDTKLSHDEYIIVDKKDA